MHTEPRTSLTLGRKEGQAICIRRGTETIVVTLRRADNGHARVSVAATPDWLILRDELLTHDKPAA
jgi:hypothetical protein